MRRSSPLLLAQPSAFAGLSPLSARLILLLIALLLAALAVTGIGSGGEGNDVPRHSGIVESLRHGGDYYAAAADAARSDGLDASPAGVRLPTLAIVSAGIAPAMLIAILWALAAAVAIAWYARLGPALVGMPPRVAAMLLVIGGMAALRAPEAAMLHETWAGLFIALSLALRSPGRATEAIALGLAAALIRETAALYLVLMAVLAWRDGARKEAIGWAAALAVFAIVVAAHLQAVSQIMFPPGPGGWPALTGIGFAMHAVTASTALNLLPSTLALLAVLFGLVGWTAWRDRLAVRTSATLLAYLTLIAISADGDEAHWALLIAPVALAGLIFAPDALRDLLTAALDRRRITVRRMVR